MYVYRISKCAFIRDMSGFGAFTYGGRWNSKGTAIIYTAGSQSLALLEALAHMRRPPVDEFCIMRLFIPDNSIAEIPLATLPGSWQRHPPPDALKAYGDLFIKGKEALALRIPSVIVPTEFNYLLNPAHERVREVLMLTEEGQPIDSRLF